MKEFSGITKKIVKDLGIATEVLKDFEGKKIVSIFGSARVPETHQFYEDTKKIAAAFSQKGFVICTGGGPGLMEAGSRGAKEVNGETLGLSIEVPHEQEPNSYLDKNVTFQNFAQRKIVFSAVSDAYVVVPGGYGSLDELFEVLTLIQCKVLKPVPIVLYNKEYWEPLLKFLRQSLLSEKMIKEEDLEMVFLANTVDEVVEHISNQV